MTRRVISGIAAGAVASAIAAHVAAQAPATPSRNQRVWTGTIDDREIMLNAHDTTPIRRPVRYYQDVNVRFRFVSEDDPNRPGYIRWVSRRLSWTGFGLSASPIEGRECSGSGSLELGPANNLDATTPEQEKQLKIPCKDWDAPNVWSFIPLPNPKVRFPIIDVRMTTCQTRRWSVGNVRYTLTVGDALELTSPDNFTIDTTPRMPDLKGEIGDPSATWEAQIAFSRGYCNGGPQFNSPRVTGTGATFTPNFGGMYGGELSVSVTTSCGAQTKTQQILGKDPGKAAIQTEIGTYTLPSPFDSDDLKRIACQESVQQQFITNGSPKFGSLQKPGDNLGGDAGIMQICWARTNGVLWDWKHNIAMGHARLLDALAKARRIPDRVRDHVVRNRLGQTGGDQPHPKATDFTDEQLRMEALQRYNAYDWDFGYWQWDDENGWVANPQRPNLDTRARAATPILPNPYADDVADCSSTCPVHCPAQQR